MRTNHEERIDINDLCHFTDKQNEASRFVKKRKYVLYGGAMGGGKSYFLRWKLLRMLLTFAEQGFHGITVGLFCEDYPALRDRHLSKIRFEFPEWLGEYNAADHNFVLYPEFGSGVIAFRNLDDVSKYQSSEFAVIAVDELTKNSEEDFTILRTRLRWPGISDTRFIGATNPGGRGHLWVKRLWIDKNFADYEQEREEFVYVKALLKDNPYINDPAYIRSLESLPTEKKRAYLEGDWDIFEGQYFEEWNAAIHVVKSFEIPDYWLRYRSIDVSGKNGVTSCHWHAVDNEGNVYVYREHYGSGRNAHEHARQIAMASRDEDYQYTIIDSSAFDHDGYSETMSEIYERQGVTGLVPSGKKQRVAGWDIVREYLKVTEKHPRLQVFEQCKNLIRTLPSLIHDPMNSDDVDSTGEDHAADELRYFLQSLRDQKAINRDATPDMNIVQRRLKDLYGDKDDFDYQYRR